MSTFLFPVRLLMLLAVALIGGVWIYFSYTVNNSSWSVVPALVGFPLLLPLAWWVGGRIDELRRVLARQFALERSLRANVARLYELIDNLRSGVFLTNSALMVVNSNRPFCQMFGLGAPPDVVTAHSSKVHALIASSFPDPNQFLERVAQLVAANEPVCGELMRMTDGRFLERDFIPIAFGRDRFGFLWLYHDITERRRWEEELKEHHAQLESKRGELEEANARLQTGWQAAQYLTEVAAAVAGGDLDRKADQAVPEDLASLAQALNRMAGGLRARIQEREASRRRIMAAQEEVRREVAEQLHGSVQSKLLVLGYKLGKVKQLVESDPGKAAGELEDVRRKLEELREDEVRGLSHRLHPAIVKMGLRPALLHLRDQFEGPYEVTMELDDRLKGFASKTGPGSKTLVLTAYRVVEELMSNALKHAQCTTVSVAVRLGDDGFVHIEVADDGIGYQPDAAGSGGLGLINAHDWVNAIGGDLETISAPGGGTRSSLRLPYRHSA